MKWAGWFLLFLVMLIGCDWRPAKTPFGHEYDATRRKYGIPVIPQSWIIERQGYRQVDWYNPVFKTPTGSRIPIHACKTVLVGKDGQLEQEEDTYYSGRQFKSLDPDVSFEKECLITLFDYRRQRLGQQPWSCSLSAGTFDTNRTLSEADEIIHSWGLQRLDDELGDEVHQDGHDTNH